MTSVVIYDAGRINFSRLPKPEEVSKTDWIIIESTFVRSDFRWIGIVDGKIACMWGLIPPTILSWSAYIWLYTNPLVEEHKFLFIRHSQRQMEQMLRLFPNIVGDCVKANTTAQRWLKFLGAKFGASQGETIPFRIGA